jgi:hypothetical protein
MTFSWVLDSGGAGRGAWQGGVLHELMLWAREHGVYPSVSMGASAGGYAAADIATGTERTVMRGWTHWGDPEVLLRYPLAAGIAREWPQSRFRQHLHASVRYVMGSAEVDAVFDPVTTRKLLIFTARIRRRDVRPMSRADLVRLRLAWPQAGSLSALLPSMLLSGMVFPLENMPLPLQLLSRLVPARYFVHALRGILLKGNGLDVLWPDLVAQAVFAVVVIGLATARFQRRLA